jgi:polar amino acid transport system substrate-binding protein
MQIGRRQFRSLGLAAAATGLVATTASAQDGGSSWAGIASRGSIRLGVTPSEPWYAKDLATGAWHGFGVSLAERIAHDIGRKVEFVETSWGTAPAGLQAGQFDVMFVLDPTPARATAIDFPFAPVLYYALGYMSRDDLGRKTWRELDTPEMTLAVPAGTAMERWVSANMHKAKITRLASIDQTILEYQSGRAKLLVLYHPALLAYRIRIGTGHVSVPQPAVTAVAGAGVRREADKTFRDFMTTVLTYYYENGTTAALYRDYIASKGIDPASVPGITKESLRQG